eukprot:jgi/Mesvir1/22801/Mv14185-RA.1
MSLSGDTAPTNLRQVQTLLWDRISALLKPAERDEVRRIIGNSVIQENEELFRECDALSEILGDLQRHISTKMQSRKLFETPARALAESEIRLLVDKLRGLEAQGGKPVGSPRATVSAQPAQSSPRPRPTSSSSFSAGSQPPLLPRPATPVRTPIPPSSRASLPECGGDASLALGDEPGSGLSSLTQHLDSKQEHQVVEYVLNTSRPGTSAGTNRPGTSNSWPRSFSQGARPTSAASSRGSGGSTSFNSLATVEEVKEQLNVFDVERVRGQIQEALADEKAALLEDAEYLQMCLEDEAETSSALEAPPPSLSELKQVGSKLERSLTAELAEREREERLAAATAVVAASPKAGRAGLIPPLPSGSGSNTPTAGSTPRKGRVGRLIQMVHDARD